MDKLSATGLVPVIREQAAQKPLLGICLGMQLLFEKAMSTVSMGAWALSKARFARWNLT